MFHVKHTIITLLDGTVYRFSVMEPENTLSFLKELESTETLFTIYEE